jgi:hypothetical protein
MGETQRCIQSRTMAPSTGNKAAEGMKLLIHHHLEPRVRINGVTPPLQHALIPRFWQREGLCSRPRAGREKSANKPNGRRAPPPQKTMF